MPVLYRTYRPKKFSEVIGQDVIVRTIQNAAKDGSFVHAYLFSGGRGVGKTTMARLLAKAANCENLKEGEVCLTCDSCTAIAAGNFLDLVEIDAASNTGVDNIRELIEQVRFQPSGGRRKVYIIDEVHMLSRGAFNALLKTLEEPPVHVIFVLATTEIHKVPATIISRTQRFTFSRVTDDHMFKALSVVAEKEQLEVSEAALKIITRHAEGSLRDGLNLLGKVATLGNKISVDDVSLMLGLTGRDQLTKLIGLIIEKRAAELPDFFDGLLESGVDMTLFTKDLLEYCRQLLVYRLTSQLSDKTFDETVISGQASQKATAEWMHLIRLILRALKDLQISPSAELPLLLSCVEAASGPDKPVIVAPLAQPEVTSQQVVDKKKAVHQQSNSALAEFNRGSSSEVPTVVGTREDLVSELEVLEDATMQEVTTGWASFVDALRTKNSPLATLIKNLPLVSVESGTVLVSVKYLFHKEHFENIKHQSLISEALKSAIGKRLRLKVELRKDQPKVEQSADGGLGDALRVFGGELVE